MQSSDFADVPSPRAAAAGMKRVVTVRGDGDMSPYVDALRTVGVEPVLGSSLDGAAGLVLLGGTDVNPDRYGEERLSETERPDNTRDKREIALVVQALERDL